VHEQYGQSWAKQMIDCLIDIKKSVDEARNISNHLPQDQISDTRCFLIEKYGIFQSRAVYRANEALRLKKKIFSACITTLNVL
jgi:hypothetical protein